MTSRWIYPVWLTVTVHCYMVTSGNDLFLKYETVTPIYCIARLSSGSSFTPVGIHQDGVEIV